VRWGPPEAACGGRALQELGAEAPSFPSAGPEAGGPLASSCTAVTAARTCKACRNAGQREQKEGPAAPDGEFVLVVPGFGGPATPASAAPGCRKAARRAVASADSPPHISARAWEWEPERGKGRTGGDSPRPASRELGILKHTHGELGILKAFRGTSTDAVPALRHTLGVVH